MKKIAYIIALFLSNFIYGQKIDLPKGFEENLRTSFEKRKNSWEGDFDLYRKIQIEIFQQKQIGKSNASVQNSTDCGDAGFESGILNPSDWGGFYKKFTISTFNCSSTISNNINDASNPWIAGLTNLSPTSCEYPGWTVNASTYCTIPSTCSATTESSLSHFYIVSTGSDPLIGSLMPMVRSGGGTRALRLGNAFPWNGTEKLTKTFTVNASNLNFSFWYALVMGKPTDHYAGQQPTFIVQVIDNAGTFPTNLKNNLVNLGNSKNYIESSDALLSSTTSYINPCLMSGVREPLAYKPWSYCSIDLSTLIGKSVTIELITRDCAPTGHFSYAYLDDFCSKVDSSNPSGFAAISTADTCGLPGRICLDYTLPKTINSSGATVTGTVKFTLNFLKGGVPVSVPIIGTLNSSGTNYCFNLPTSLPGLSSTDCFDYYIKADYTLSGVSLPSQFIGSPFDGIKSGMDNDYCVTCPSNCKCGQWAITIYTLNNKDYDFSCNNGGTTVIQASQGDIISMHPNFICSGGTIAAPCNATYKYDVYYPKGGELHGITDITKVKLDSCGLTRVVITPYCGGKPCPPCEFSINVNCCNCNPNLTSMLSWQTTSGSDSLLLRCGETYTNKLDCFKDYTISVKNPCGADCKPDSIKTTVTYPNGTSAVSYSLFGTTLSTGSMMGTFTVSIMVKCHGVWCKECKITFIQTKSCPPPCNNCKDKVQATFNSGSSNVSVQNFPAASTLNASLVLNGGSDTYTQLRVNVVDIQVSSDNPACLQCYNTPNQWGSILGGSLSVSGFTSASTTYGSIPTSNLYNNSREIVFTAATATAIPASSTINLNMQIPGVNPISCCCIKVKVFLKITYRNNKCEECSKVVLIDLTECPGANGVAGTYTFAQNSSKREYQIASPNKDANKPVNFSSGSVDKDNKK